MSTSYGFLCFNGDMGVAQVALGHDYFSLVMKSHCLKPGKMDFVTSDVAPPNP